MVKPRLFSTTIAGIFWEIAYAGAVITAGVLFSFLLIFLR